MRRDLLYVAFCLIFPALWGIVSAQIFDRFQAFIARRRTPLPNGTPMVEEPDPDMYHI
jgi:hypothetical protein